MIKMFKPRSPGWVRDREYRIFIFCKIYKETQQVQVEGHLKVFNAEIRAKGPLTCPEDAMEYYHDMVDHWYHSIKPDVSLRTMTDTRWQITDGNANKRREQEELTDGGKKKKRDVVKVVAPENRPMTTPPPQASGSAQRRAETRKGAAKKLACSQPFLTKITQQPPRKDDNSLFSPPRPVHQSPRIPSPMQQSPRNASPISLPSPAARSAAGSSSSSTSSSKGKSSSQTPSKNGGSFMAMTPPTSARSLDGDGWERCERNLQTQLSK